MSNRIIVEFPPLLLEQLADRAEDLGWPCRDEEEAPSGLGDPANLDAALEWLRSLDEHGPSFLDGFRDEHASVASGPNASSDRGEHATSLGDRDGVGSLDAHKEELELVLFAALLQIPAVLAFACHEHLDVGTAFTVRGLGGLAALAVNYFNAYGKRPPMMAMREEARRLFAWDRRHWPYYAGRIKWAYDYACPDLYAVEWLRGKLRELALRSKEAGVGTL